MELVTYKHLDRFGRFESDIKEVDSVKLHVEILEKHGINASINKTSKALFLAVKTQFSAFTVMKTFIRHNPMMKATGVNEFVIAIPF